MKTSCSYEQSAKLAIKNSFELLLQSHHFGKITVQMICRTAGCNRSTFYAHYDGIREIFDEIKNEILNKYTKLIAENDDTPVRKRLLLKAVAENRGFFTEYFSYCSRDIVNLSEIEKSISKQNEIMIKTHQITAVQFTFIKYGALEVLRQWLASGCEKPAEELADELIDIVNSIILPKPEGNADHGDGSGS